MCQGLTSLHIVTESIVHLLQPYAYITNSTKTSFLDYTQEYIYQLRLLLGIKQKNQRKVLFENKLYHNDQSYGYGSIQTPRYFHSKWLTYFQISYKTKILVNFLSMGYIVMLQKYCRCIFIHVGISLYMPTSKSLLACGLTRFSL